jgi:putative membrane protein
MACYTCARVLEIAPTTIPRMAIVSLEVLSAMAFALTDGARRYGVQGILVFAGLCVLVGNGIENIGVVTGIPFGRYYFVELMGPKLFHVPMLLGLAYIGMAYVSWTLASTILNCGPERQKSSRIFAVPFLAGFIMTSWDLAQDPVWSTVLQGWVWIDGGPWFGVPISNYVGWYGTVLLIDLFFAWYLFRYSSNQTGANRSSARPALLFYLLCAAGNISQSIPQATGTVAQDPTGRRWLVADITRASALVSIFVMGSFVAIAWMRMARTTDTITD